MAFTEKNTGGRVRNIAGFLVLVGLLVLLRQWSGGDTEGSDRVAGATTPAKGGPYVTVYGRDSCGYTKSLLSELADNGLRHDYRIVDKPAVASRLHERMRAAGLSTRRYRLPVVDVNGRFYLRPGADTVQNAYNDAFQ